MSANNFNLFQFLLMVFSTLADSMNFGSDYSLRMGMIVFPLLKFDDSDITFHTIRRKDSRCGNGTKLKV